DSIQGLFVDLHCTPNRKRIGIDAGQAECSKRPTATVAPRQKQEMSAWIRAVVIQAREEHAAVVVRPIQVVAHIRRESSRNSVVLAPAAERTPSDDADECEVEVNRLVASDRAANLERVAAQ